MKHFIVVTVSLTFIALFANAEEQILFVSGQLRDAEIYRQILGRQPERLTFSDGRDLQPALSPDGTKMAYVSSINRILEIAVLDFKFGKPQQLTFSPFLKRNLHPTWSPDGSRLAFSSDRDGDMDIYVMDADGNNATNMTDNSRWDDSWPHWSPVSQRIVFTSNPDDGPNEINVLDVQTGNQQKYTTSSYFPTYPRWSPDGSRIAYLSGELPEIPPVTRAIWRVKPDGTELEALVTEGESNSHPKYSPDGKWIVFASERDANTDIYTLNLETKALKRLTTHPSNDTQPDWSPDGERVAFVSDRDGNPNVFTITVDREQVTNLTKSGMEEYRPTWSPDGEKIAFNRRMVDRSRKIYVMDSDGENEFKLVDLPFDSFFPAWSPLGDVIAFVSISDLENSMFRIYTVGNNGENLQVLYEHASIRIGEFAWSSDGTQLVISRDGSRIDFLDTLTKEVRGINVPGTDPDDPNWSPDGEEITFSGFPPRKIGIWPRYGVFIIDSNGNPVRNILMDTRRLDYSGLSWSPDGARILIARNGGLYTLDVDTESMELFIESGSEPDWQDPSVPRSVTPRNKLAATWGDMKIAEKHRYDF